MTRTVALALALGFAVAACGSASRTGDDDGAAPTFGSTPLASAKSASGALTLDLFTSPSPPVRGEDDAELAITDDTGAAVDGLTVKVVPWMPSMGHGSSVVPAVSAEGGGKYLVRRLELFMPGTWELRVSISGARTDDAVFDVSIP